MFDMDDWARVVLSCPNDVIHHGENDYSPEHDHTVVHIRSVRKHVSLASCLLQEVRQIMLEGRNLHSHWGEDGAIRECNELDLVQNGDDVDTQAQLAERETCVR